MASIKTEIFRPKYHYRIYIPLLKMNLFISKDLRRKGNVDWKANGA